MALFTFSQSVRRVCQNVSIVNDAINEGIENFTAVLVGQFITPRLIIDPARTKILIIDVPDPAFTDVIPTPSPTPPATAVSVCVWRRGGQVGAWVRVQ